MLIIDINNRKIYNKDSQFKICLVIKNMTFIYIKLLDVNIQYHWCIDKRLDCFGEKTLERRRRIIIIRNRAKTIIRTKQTNITLSLLHNGGLCSINGEHMGL
jgi:hypothetical protein